MSVLLEQSCGLKKTPFYGSTVNFKDFRLEEY